MRRLLFYAKPYTALFVVVVFVVLVSSIVDLTPPLLVRNAIDKYMNDQQLGAQERFSGLSQTSLLL
ncbi:MAG: ABC transporter ATP-binding protein, partial [Thermotogaceae bacterium]|nr:ABC transporter ATP-binding protein [Thermotogaceae bacterium]